MSVMWKNPLSKTEALLTKENGEVLELRVGLFIKYGQRKDGVKIEEFTWKGSDPRGPIGITYLPWRPNEKRWGSHLWSMKGNLRHLICFPVGFSHFGEQINWETVEILGECPKSTEELETQIKLLCF